nr:hypothetical protein [Tanacetum cinerariifolium]
MQKSMFKMLDGDVAQGDDTAAYREVLTISQEPSIPSPTPPPQLPQDLPSTSQGNSVRVLKLQRLKRVRASHVVDTSEDTIMDDASNQGRIIDELDKDDVVALMDDKEEDKKEEEAKVAENDQVQGRQAESQAEIYKIDMDHALKVLSMQEDEPAKVQMVVDVVTTAKLITEVVTAAVVIRDPKEESTTSSIIPVETKSKDKGKGIMVEEPKPLKKKQQIKMAKEYARKLHARLNKDIEWDVAIDHVKLKAKEDPAIQRYQAMKRKPQTEAQARRNMIIETRCTCSSLEKSKGYTWSSKGQELKANGIMRAAKQKLMLLDSAAEGRLMLLSQVSAANVILMLSRQSEDC